MHNKQTHRTSVRKGLNQLLPNHSISEKQALEAIEVGKVVGPAAEAALGALDTLSNL